MEIGQFKQNGVHLEEHEYNTVKLLLNCGYDIELIPASTVKGFKMPDLVMQGQLWEMKSPQGGGKKTIENTLQTAAKQGKNIIIDLRRCKVDEIQAIKDVQRYFSDSKIIRHIIIITKEELILDLKK